MVTIKDVARLARVSTATVSAVINESSYVSPPLEARVRQTMEEVGYRPNLIARSLKTQRTRTLGFLLSDVTNLFYPEVVRGFGDAVGSAGYGIFLCETDDDPKKELSLVRSLLSRRVDGIAFASTSMGGRELTRLQEADFPFMLVNRSCVEVAADYVGIDNVGAARRATRYLLDLGHRAIAFINGRANHVTSSRMEGYRRCLAEAGIPFDPKIAFHTSLQRENAYAATLDLLRQSPRPFTAAIAGNDVMALGIMQAAFDLGLRVPDDLSIVGFDDLPVSGWLRVPLTTIGQSNREMGAMAGRLLLERIERGPALPPRTVLLETYLAERTSSGPAPDGDSGVHSPVW